MKAGREMNDWAVLFVRLALAFATITQAYGSDTWPQFRGPTGDGISTATPPREWSEDVNVDWKVKIEGIAWSQPIIWKKHVFVTTAVADGQPRPLEGDRSAGVNLLGFLSGNKPAKIDCVWKLICLDIETGSRVWEREVYSGRPAVAIHRSNSYASETPATDGKYVFVQVPMVGLWCFDTRGNQVWKKELEPHAMQLGWGTGASPVLHHDSLYLVYDNENASHLARLDKHTGDELWRVERKEKSGWATPYLWKNKLRNELVVGGGSKIRSYNLRNGEILWSHAADGRSVMTAVGNSDLIVIGSVNRINGTNGTLCAISAGASGELAEGEDSIAWTAANAAPEIASPVLAGKFLLTFRQHGGMMSCFDVMTGKRHYRKRLKQAGVFTASPWTDGKHVYCLNENGRTFVIEPSEKHKLVSTHELNGMFWGSPAVIEGKLLLRSAEHVYCISE